MEMPLPSGEKLSIQSFLPQDRDDAVRVWTDQESMKRYADGAWGLEKARQRFDTLLDRWKQFDGLGGFAVRGADGTFYGVMNSGTMAVDPQWKGEGLEPYKGQTFLSIAGAGFPEFWDHGYGQAGAYAFVNRYHCELLNPEMRTPNNIRNIQTPISDRILVTANKDNIPSIKILEALGFDRIAENVDVGYGKVRDLYLSKRIDENLYNAPILVAQPSQGNATASTSNDLTINVNLV